MTVAYLYLFSITDYTDRITLACYLWERQEAENSVQLEVRVRR